MPVPFDTLHDHYDAIIIGSGLGGLTTANRLARCGHKILLLEQHHQLGGLATWFKRRGHIFDVSLHGFPYGMVKTCKKYWGREIMDSIVQLKGIVFNNPQFSLCTSFDTADFTRLLEEHFKISRSTIDAFFTTVGQMNFYDDQAMTTLELFEKFFPGRSDVHRLLMEPITYANGSSLEDPAITYGIVFSNFMNRGVFTFRGGTDRLIAMMTRELEGNGVTICTKSRVSAIIIEGKKARGVIVNGKTITAKAVISNAGITNTIDELTDASCLSPLFRKESAAVRVNNSSCQVYFGIREDKSIPDLGDLIFSSTAERFSASELLDPHTQSRTFSLYYPKTRPGHDRYTIVASMNARFSDWQGLDAQAYATAKQDLITRTTADLRRYVPEIDEITDWVEAASPTTFQRYTLHTEGTSFGTKFEGLEISRQLSKEIAGLFHVGSVGIIMSGWLGAINYGVIVANDADMHIRSA